jgi:hypothetical protein
MTEPDQAPEPVDHPGAIEYDAPAANLVEALARAQSAFPPISKTKTGEVKGTNRQGREYSYTYQYADLADVLGAARPVLAREGIALVQRLTTAEDGKVRLVTELRRGDEVIDSALELGRTTSDPQQFGGALTYLRRYSASTMLGIAPEEDLDAQHVETAPRNGNGNGRAELPGWATRLPDDAVVEVGTKLTVLIGEDRARSLLRDVHHNAKGIPTIVKPLVGRLLDEVLAESAEGRIAPRLLAELNRREAEGVAAEAEAARARQDADAETPPVTGDVPADTDGLPAGRRDLGPETLGDEAELDPALEARPPAGTVKVDLPADATVEARMRLLRAAGCICNEPLAPDADRVGSGKRSDECPIDGHGIPF